MASEASVKSVAILLATYNGEKFLKEQLDSIMNQTFVGAKCYIHDDGSTDETINIINEYQELYPERVIVVDGPVCGGSKANFMFLLHKIDADYYFFCDQDDVWGKDKIEKMLIEFAAKEDEAIPCVMFSDLIVTDEQLNTIADSYFDYIGANPERIYYRQLLIQNFIAGCSMLFNRKAAEMARQYENIDNIYMHDWWIVLIAALVGKVLKSEYTLTFYRQHSSNEIGAQKRVTILDVIAHVFGTVFGKHKKEILERIYRPRRMAKELYKIPGLNSEEKNFLIQFSNIDNKGKLSRVRFYLKHQLFRNNHRNWLTMFFV